MIKKPEISEATKAHLATIRAKGAKPTDEEIVWLYNLGEIVKHGDERDSDTRLLLNKPFVYVVDGKEFRAYNLTVGAKLWYHDYALMWWDGDQRMTSLALLYAINNAPDLEAFRFRNKLTARLKVMKFGWSLTLTDDHIDTILYDLKLSDEEMDDDFPSKKSNDKSASDKSITPHLALLLNSYPGTSVDYWLWEVSEEYLLKMLNHAVQLKSNTGVADIDASKTYAHWKMNKIAFEATERAKDGE